MVGRQVIANKAIAKAVEETTRSTILAMAAATTERSQSKARPKIGGPDMKQPCFNWEADNKYSELETFRLEINNILTMYNTPQT